MQIKTKNTVNTKKVKEKTQRANLESIQHAVAAIQSYILKSIHKGKTDKKDKRIPSKPGRLPKTWDNRSQRSIKRNIRFNTAYDLYKRQTIGTVYAKPNKSGDHVYHMLEFGGSQYITMRIVEDRKKRGGNRTYKSYNDRAPDEVQNIKNYYANIVRLKKVKEVKVKANYEKRPFMEPAVQKVITRLPDIWKSKIQKYYF